MRPVEVSDDPQMARLDPRASKLKYRMERLLLTPFFRFALRVLLPFGLCFGAGAAWFSVEDNREAFRLMLSDVRAAIEERPEFQVRMMAIDGASPGLADAIRAELSVDFPASSFDLDLDGLQRRATMMDAVKLADLRVRQGGILQVDVVQRVPVVLWRAEDGLHLLDEDGVFVGAASHRAGFADLPVVAGDIMRPEMRAAMLALRRAEIEGEKALRDLDPETRTLGETGRLQLRAAVEEARRLNALTGPVHDRLRGFERIGGRRWDVVLDRDQRIMLPESGAEQALQRVLAMAEVEEIWLLRRDLLAVDLRLPRRPTIRMTDAATQEMWRIKANEAGKDVVR